MAQPCKVFSYTNVGTEKGVLANIASAAQAGAVRKKYNFISCYAFFPQHFLYFLPLPHGHGSFLPIFFSLRIVPDCFCSR